MDSELECVDEARTLFLASLEVPTPVVVPAFCSEFWLTLWLVIGLIFWPRLGPEPEPWPVLGPALGTVGKFCDFLCFIVNSDDRIGCGAI